MPCKLRKSTKPGIDFEGTLPAQVQLGISSDSGGATIVAVIYDGTNIPAPFAFPLSLGVKLLTVLVDDPVPKDWTTIEELCNATRNPLLHYPFDPYGPTQNFRIEGL